MRAAVLIQCREVQAEEPTADAGVELTADADVEPTADADIDIGLMVCGPMACWPRRAG